MNRDEAYAAWAPEEGPWSPWVKPIVFATHPSWDEPGELAGVPAPAWPSALEPSTALVLDLPGAEGVLWGVALVRLGWRPVPLYNALPGNSAGDPTLDNSALVDVAPIVRALGQATPFVLAQEPHGPPAFLLDARRRFGTGMPANPGLFDNRSISLPTDFPSAVFLRSRGIERVVLVQPADGGPQEDLAHTLLAWQREGVEILAQVAGAAGPPQVVRIKPPSWFRALFYRFLATLGLRRHPLGGFGGTIPQPSSG